MRGEFEEPGNNNVNLTKELEDHKTTSLASLVQFKDFKDLKIRVNGLKNGCKTLDKKVSKYKIAMIVISGD